MLQSEREGLKLRRKVQRRDDGLIGLHQEFIGTATRTIVTHGFFLITYIDVTRGRLSFPLAAETIEPPKQFLLLVPPRSVLPMKFEGARVITHGVAGRNAYRHHPIALLAVAGDCTIDGDTGKEMLADTGHRTIDPDRGVPAYVRQGRRYLHDHLRAWAPVHRTARHVGVEPETLTRAFTSAYGVGPKEYGTKAKLFQAILFLLTGATIDGAAFSSGFNDLKRFYAHFGSRIGATPGAYARLGRANRIDRKEP